MKKRINSWLVALTVHFDLCGIGELAAVIPKKDGHEPGKNVRSQFEIQPVKDIQDTLGIIGIPDKGKHA